MPFFLRLAAYAVPALTSLHVPYMEMAVAAARLPIQQIKGEIAGSCQQIVKSHLVVRNSAGPCAGHGFSNGNVVQHSVSLRGQRVLFHSEDADLKSVENRAEKWPNNEVTW